MSTELERASAIVHGLVAGMRASPARLPPGVPDPLAAEARLEGAVPALTGEPLLEWDGLLCNARAVAEALAETDAGYAALLVVARLERPAGGLDREALRMAALAGAWDLTAELASGLRLDGDALTTVVDYAARPALRAGVAALGPLLADPRWRHGRCPACGAPPALSVIRGKEHERRLHCGRCGTAWFYPRVRCPSCGERNHEQLGNLHAVGEGEYRRAEVCESCRAYVKTVTLLDAPDADRVLELDLETAALDFMALERGYSRLVL